MAIPVTLDDIEYVLRPWLGSLFLTSNTLMYTLYQRLQVYAPYRQTLSSLRDELESILLTSINRFTRSSMTVLTDRYQSRRLSTDDIFSITDDLMGIIFRNLTPFSANFIKLNDYSLHFESLAALHVLYDRYSSYYTTEQFAFMVKMIHTVYPPERYHDWLKD